MQQVYIFLDDIVILQDNENKEGKQGNQTKQDQENGTQRKDTDRDKDKDNQDKEAKCTRSCYRKAS